MCMRMDFDIEIAVRLCWAGLPVVNLPTAVRYHEGGVSHFHMFRDTLASRGCTASWSWRV